jgi:hypothetical protein
MTRPTFEVADILRAQGRGFLIAIDPALAFSSSKRFGPFCAAAPQRCIAMPARAAVIRPSPTTRAEIGTAPSARRSGASAGRAEAGINLMLIVVLNGLAHVHVQSGVIALDFVAANSLYEQWVDKKRKGVGMRRDAQGDETVLYWSESTPTLWEAL